VSLSILSCVQDSYHRFLSGTSLRVAGHGIYRSEFDIKGLDKVDAGAAK